MNITKVIGFEFECNYPNNNMYFLIAHEASVVQGIKGLASGVFFDNLKNSFLDVSIFSIITCIAVVRYKKIFNLKYLLERTTHCLW